MQDFVTCPLLRAHTIGHDKLLAFIVDQCYDHACLRVDSQCDT